MKKILIVNNNMRIGGVQKALVNLLWCIRGDYDITLLLFHKGGECLKDLPPEIRVITPNLAYRYLGMTKYDAVGIWNRLIRGFFAAITRLFGRKYAIALMSLGQKKLEGYDVAISYLHNSGDKMFYGGCNDFVLNCVSAKKKMTFLHGDYRLCGADTRENGRQYARFDVIAACSQGCANAFLQCHPEMAEKVHIVPNCHRFADIRAKAEASPVSLAGDKINIVTVARFGKEKGVERALRAIAGIGSLREKLHYYIVGDGVQKPLLLQIIKEEKLADTVTLCGMLENPYGYIKAADLLLIPSYSEAAPLVIGEAACLGTPILSTETSSAREMIEDSGFGWVCENREAAMGIALTALLAEPNRLQDAKSRLLHQKMDNDTALSQFIQSVSLS